MMNFKNISGNKDNSEQTSPVCEIAYSRILAQKLELIAGVETVYSPQSFAAMAHITGLHSMLQKQLSDVALSKIEGLVALYLALSEVSSPKGFTAVLTLYAKTHSQSSLVSQLTQISENLFTDFVPQDSAARPEWLSQMVSGLTDWKLLTASPAFKKVSRVLSLMVTMGVIDSQSFTLGNFEVFAVRASEKQASAIDLVDALIETTVFFAEGAYQCFLQGSLRPIFFSTSEIVQMEEAYIEKNTEFEFVRNGNLEKFKGKSESQFDKELTTLIEKLADLYKTMPAGAEKKIVQTKWEALSKMSAEFAALRVKGGLRKAPFCVKVYGSSGVGKSTFSDLTMATVLKANNKPATSDYIVTLNEKEKYMSTYRSFVTGIKIDDYGNTKSNFWESAPSDWIIKICNNVREAAVMADVANKGKISIEPACLTITTNVEDLHAGVTSNCPMSILRRAHVHVELKVRPEFATDGMLDSQKVVEAFGNLDEVNDIWLINVKKPVAGVKGDTFNNWEIVKENISIQQYLDFLVEESRKHFRAQDIIVESFKEPSGIIQFCDQCNKLEGSCTCEVEPQFGDRIAHVLKTKTDSMRVRAHYHSNVLQTRAEDFAVSHLLKMLNQLEESPYSQWTNWVPTQLLDNEYVKSAILYAGADYIKESVVSYVRKYVMMVFLMMSLTFPLSVRLTILVGIVSFVLFLIYYAGIVETKKEAYFKAIVERNGSLHEAFKSARDKHVHYACGLLASLGVLYGAVQVVKALRKSMGIQGSLMPRSVADIQERDKEANPWANTTEDAPVTSQNSFTNHKETKNAMSSLMAQMVVNGKFTGCFMVKTNVVAVPKHFLPTDTTKAEITYCKRKFAFILNPKYAVQVGVADMVLIYVPNTGPLKDSSPFFCDNYAHHPLVCKMTGLTRESELFEDFLTWNQVAELSNGFMSFPGSHYRLGKGTTFPGMCMSVITRDAKRSSIIGFHIGGVSGTDRGCGMSVLRSELDKAVEQLHSLNDAFVCGPQAHDIPEVVMGQKIVLSEDVHRKCPSQFIDSDGAAITVYGTITGRSTYRSKVIATPISKVVEEVTGVSNKWGPPRFDDPVVRDDGFVDNQKWKPWYKSLEVCSKPSIGFDPADVQIAMDDYSSGLEDVFEGMKDVWQTEIRPLSNVEIVSGIDGKRFLDGVNASTSMGYPINKKKTGFLVDLPPTEANACPRTFTSEIWEEFDAAMQLADEGYSMNQIFGGSLKDEPTVVTKEKVRVFQAAPIVLQIAIRKYFLSIARFLSANPLIAECAVGINSHGPEWHELSQYMARFGDDRIIAGDYSKYDLRMPEQLTLAAFKVMIKLAQMTGNYSAKDIKRMECIAFEVCSPLVAFNGTLMRFMGTNPSGQNMTVYLNSIVNSLLHRLAFNSVYNEKRRAEIGEELGLGRPVVLRDLCALATYGDDAKGSVMEGYDEFNHISMAKFLEANDMKFTMPDKESEPVAFMNRFVADFLKRKDVFNPDLGVYVGRLDEDSIFKSLHSILESKVVSPIEVSRMNIEGALREWFFYGEKHYEMRREQMKKIAGKTGIETEQLEMTYQDRVDNWKHKYEPQSGEFACPGVTDLMNVRHSIYDGTRYPKKVRNLVVGMVALPDDELRRKHAELTLAGIHGQRHSLTAIELILKYRNTVPLDVWELSACSMSTIDEPMAVRSEHDLLEDVKSVLGKPLLEEYVIIDSQFGAGDLLYKSQGTILVIECKRVVGRHPVHAEKVVKQARRYGKVMKVLLPDYTVYCMTFTEHGFTIVDVLGEPRFPKKFEDVLDIAEIHWD